MDWELRTAYMLTVKEVKNAKGPKWYGDGKGLYLKVTATDTKSWVFRWRDKASGKLRDMGLGPVTILSLADARVAAQDAHRIVRGNGDPVAKKKIEKVEEVVALSKNMTFDQAAAQYIATKIEPESKNAKHVQQWTNTIATYASPVIGSLPLDEINRHHVLAILEPIWTTKTETATRLRQRIERVLGWATVMDLRDGENPARWENYLDNVLPSPGKIKTVKHFESMPYSELHEFLKDLRQRPATAARALEYTILTAARSGDVRGAQWDEINLKTKTWTVSAARMKMKREHKVPLSSTAIKLLENQKGEHEKWVFPGERGKNCLSNMAMETLLRRMGRKPITVHGMRSSFKTWCQEKATKYPDEASELALAHVNSDATRSAYAKSQLIDIRRKLMADWAKFVK